MDRKRSAMEQPTGSKGKCSKKNLKVRFAGGDHRLASFLGNKKDHTNMQGHQDLVFTNEGKVVLCGAQDQPGPNKPETKMFDLDMDDFGDYCFSSDEKTDDSKFVECPVAALGTLKRAKGLQNLTKNYSLNKSSEKKMGMGIGGCGDGLASIFGKKNNKTCGFPSLSDYQDLVLTNQETVASLGALQLHGPNKPETKMFELDLDDFQDFNISGNNGETEDAKVIEGTAADNGRRAGIVREGRRARRPRIVRRPRRAMSLLDLDENNSLSSNSELLDVAADPQLRIHILPLIIGCPISEHENVLVDELLEAIGHSGDLNLNTEIVVYLPRGRSYSPFLELYQIQLATYIRMRKISHKFEVISNEAEVVPAIRFNGHDISDPKLCCELIKRAFPNDQLSEQSAKRERLNITFGKNIYLGILLWQWCSGKENEMKKLSPGYSSSTVVLTQIKVQELVNREAKELWEDRDVIECINDSISIASSELGDNDFFLGNQPEDIDCAAFVLFSQLTWKNQGSPFRDELSKHKNLSAFMMKMNNLFWPEWQPGYPLPMIWGATQFGSLLSEDGPWSSEPVQFSWSETALSISSHSSQDEVLKKMKGLRI